MTLAAFEAQLTPAERALADSLNTPNRIQAFLDTVAYEPDYTYRCPLRVLRERRGHCYDGALFAAAMLRRQGHPPLIVDLLPEPETDDDHVLAVFKRQGCFGAVGQSNFVGLRYREPVYRTLRELVMSYFEAYFNQAGQRTLRSYSPPLDLRPLDRFNWMVDDVGSDIIEQRLARSHHYPVLSAQSAAELTLLDPRSLAAGLLGSNPAGLFKLPA